MICADSKRIYILMNRRIGVYHFISGYDLQEGRAK